MHYIELFSGWLKTTKLSAAVLHYSWVWPTCEILHFVGMAFLIGFIGLLDFRILGIGKGLSMGGLNKLVPWGIAGFLVNVVTGFLFYAGDPDQYLHNPAFQFKMLFIVVAGLNVMYFYFGGVLKRVEALGPTDEAPVPAKIVAAVSLITWVAVMYCGRMLPYLGNAF
jgi:hypothetical protein